MNNTKFECPNCNQPFEASEDMAGEEIDCPACHSKVAVPFSGVQRGMDARSAKRTISLSVSTVVTACVLAVVLGALLVVWGAWLGSLHARKQVQDGALASWGHEKVESTRTAPSQITSYKQSSGAGNTSGSVQDTEKSRRVSSDTEDMAAKSRQRNLEKADTELQTQLWIMQMAEIQRRSEASRQQTPSVTRASLISQSNDHSWRRSRLNAVQATRITSTGPVQSSEPNGSGSI